MNLFISWKKILGILVIAVFAYFFDTDNFSNRNFSEMELNKALNTAKSLENSTSIDDALSALETHNTEALRQFSRLESQAKSKDSIRFVELTAIQNEIAASNQELLAAMADDLRFLENFNFETESSEQWGLLDSRLEILCPMLKSNILMIDKVVKILDQKVILAKRPDVIKELFGGYATWIDAIEQFRDSQFALFESSELGYKNLGCDIR